MGAFDAFIENGSDISAWIKCMHRSVPDEEGYKREKQRKRLAAERHCLNCTALSGCYFVTNHMPGKLSDEMLHPHCDCTYNFISANIVKKQIVTHCPQDKFQSYVWGEKGIRGGKAKAYEELGFTIEDMPYLISELEKQAREKYARGEYALRDLDHFGQRIRIEITLSGNGDTAILRTGWLVHPLGYIHCTTPFTGYGEK